MNKQLEKINILSKKLAQNQFLFCRIIGVNKAKGDEILKGEKSISKKDIKELIKHFNGLKYNDIVDDNIDISMVENAELKKLHIKIRYLNEFLIKNKEITLARAISMRSSKMAIILTGEKFPSLKTIANIAHYFFLKPKDLLSDQVELPKIEDLKIDEELYNIQKEDKDNKMRLFQHRHFLSRNYRVLSFPKRLKLIASLILITIPLIGFSSYCMYEVINEKLDTIQKYKEGSEDSIYDKFSSSQTKLHEDLKSTSKEENNEAYYCNVITGVTLYRIHDISADTPSYKVNMDLYYYFDKDEFKMMFKQYAKNVLLEQIIIDWEDDTNSSFKGNFGDWLIENEEYYDTWVDKNDKLYYPGENSSNVFTDKNSMFKIGNGTIDADTISYVKELEEIQNDDGSITCYQKLSFGATFNKAFDSSRYPLDSIQFKMYIQPTMDANYIRYIPDYSTNSDGEGLSGFSPYFAIDNGYRLLNESEDIDNFNLRLNYYKDVNNDPAIDYDHTIKTQLEIIVRANRQGISLFLQAFINLFSVAIWIIIAFYNQSYNNQESIGMLGTGLFGVISSMLVGLSMMSDAGIFSIITMINIFTLAIIMIMTYQAISSTRAQVKKDNIMIAYNNVKLRIMFAVILVCTLFMFIGLPCSSYLFGL